MTPPTGESRPSAGRKPSILVASANVGDAAMVKRLLEAEHDRVFVSTDPDRVVEDFALHAPDVLVLAFDRLQLAEQYYLGLYRLSGRVHLHPHRTVVLCGKDEVMQAYQACKKEYFDDYVLFWPVSHDAPRLLMAVHHALLAMEATRDVGPTVAEFAVQARMLAGLEPLLDRQIAAAAPQAPPQWAADFREECAPHMASVRNLNTLADRIVQTILVVDDDAFQRKFVGKLLEASRYCLVYAASGAEALGVLRRIQPDLILMDVVMPDMDGIETTRRLKAEARFAQVPVIMVTGKNEGVTVRNSMLAGASNFLVKPFDRPTLLAKVARALGRT